MDAPGSYCFIRASVDASGLLKLARDFDLDGHVDLVIVDEGSGVAHIAFGDGEGHFADVRAIDLPAPIFRAPYFDPSLFAFDQDGDRMLDFGLSFSTSQELWVVANLDEREFEFLGRTVSRLGSSAPLPLDVDLDGDDDLVLGGGIGSTESTLDLLVSASGSYEYHPVSAMGAWSVVTATTALGPISDGVARVLAVGTWAGIRDESPVLEFAVRGGAIDVGVLSFMAGADPAWLMTGRVDDDELIDVVVGNRASADFSVARPGLGRDQEPGWTTTRLDVGERPECLEHGCTTMAGAAAGDLDGDGRIELLATMNRERGRAHLYIVGDGDEPLVWIGHDAHLPITADFNEDRIDDIAFSHPDGVELLLSSP